MVGKMSLDPITAGIDLFKTIVDKVFPDKSEEEKQHIAQEMALQAQDTDLLKGQLQINQQEASNSNLFVSGWRPSIGWICALAFVWSFVLQPICFFIATLCGFPATKLPVLDLTQLMPVLVGMLGLGGYRTIERLNGVIPKGK